ncbi:hypothetical protein [Viscerimonas tarda]
MEDKVIATIDISRPAGRKIVRELEKKKSVRLEYPAPDNVVAAIDEGRTHTHKEVWGEIEKRFNEHYGTNIKFV